MSAEVEPNLELIRGTAEAFHGRREVRLLGNGKPRSFICEGADEMAAVAIEHDGSCGIYFGLNPTILPAGPRPSGLAVKEEHIKRFEFLPFDVDPKKGEDKRPLPGEPEAAEAEARELLADLQARGWPVAYVGTSGWGVWIICRVDQPNDPASAALRRSVLWAFRSKYERLDTATYDAPRVARFFGTRNVKYGDARPTTLYEAGGRDAIVTADQLHEAIASFPDVSENGSGRVPAPPIMFGPDIPPGQSHATMLSTVGKLARGGHIPPDEIFTLAKALGSRTPDDELRQMITHAIEGERSKPATPGPTAETQPPASTEVLHLTDLGNARRLVRQHGHNLRYCRPQRCWYVWDGWMWKPDATGEVFTLAKRTVDAIWGEIARASETKAKTDISKWAAESEATSRRWSHSRRPSPGFRSSPPTSMQTRGC